jgi:acyl carrier protein
LKSKLWQVEILKKHMGCVPLPPEQQKPVSQPRKCWLFKHTFFMTTESRVKKIIAENFGSSINNMTDGLSLQNDLGADSLDRLHVVLDLEEEFNISLDDEAIANLETVGQIVAHIKERTSMISKY